jgi:hypothetical protein
VDEDWVRSKVEGKSSGVAADAEPSDDDEEEEEEEEEAPRRKKLRTADALSVGAGSTRLSGLTFAVTGAGVK